MDLSHDASAVDALADRALTYMASEGEMAFAGRMPGGTGHLPTSGMY